MSAGAFNALRSTGAIYGHDFAYMEGGINFGGVKIYGTFAINVHNGNVYVPITANASGNNVSKISGGVNIGYGRVVNAPSPLLKSKYTDDGLNGYGSSMTMSYGAGSGTYSTTRDGSVQMLSADIGKVYGGSKKLVGLDFASTGMKRFDLGQYNIKYDSTKKEYVNTKSWRN
nr:hypothetical protein [uncultured Psychrobacter sp.]